MFVLNDYVSPDKFEQFWSSAFLLHIIIINDNDNNITYFQQYKYLKCSVLIILSFLQIFKDGKKTTRERALKKGIHVVSVLWVESCRQSSKCVSEDLFPVVVPEQAVTPLMVGRLKRTKSMQPKAFEEDVQNSAGVCSLVLWTFALGEN